MTEEYTSELLSLFNGENKTHVMIAIKGNVYDVNARREMYLGEGELANFPGKDVTYALAKNTLTDVQQDYDYESFTKEEKENVDKWEIYYKGKYKSIYSF
jgi:membrane-associated progesterone receptor component